MTTDSGELTTAERRELNELRAKARQAEIETIARDAARDEVNSLRDELRQLREAIAELDAGGDDDDEPDDDDEAPRGREPEGNGDEGQGDPTAATPRADEAPNRGHMLHRRIGGKRQ